jgi:hypothetical protein
MTPLHTAHVTMYEYNAYPLKYTEDRMEHKCKMLEIIYSIVIGVLSF